jgi:hypothetical protein
MREPTLLSGLPLAGGLRYGVWSAWPDGDPDPDSRGLLLLHADSGSAVRVVFGSNGWFDYRTPSAEWFTAYSEDFTELDAGDCEPLVRELFGAEAGTDWPAGVFDADQWRFDVGPGRLLLLNPDNQAPIVVHRDRPLITFFKKPPAGLEV